MRRIVRVVRVMWSKVLMRRYRHQGARSVRIDRDAEERLDQLNEGIQSYGRPGPIGPF
jgi:hypothetical protein